MIQAIYLMSRTGLPISYVERSELETDSITKVTLFSGALTAIQALMKDMDVGQATEIETKNNAILFATAEQLALVVVLDKNDKNKEQIQKMLGELLTQLCFDLAEDLEEKLLTDPSIQTRVHGI